MSYPGGKGACFRHLINLMPPHRTYVESHLGHGAVMLNKRPAEHSLGIELDPAVVAEWCERRRRVPGLHVLAGDSAFTRWRELAGRLDRLS